MPVTGPSASRRTRAPAGSRTRRKWRKPDYYSVYLADSDVTAEITPTERAAQFRFTFPKTDKPGS